MSNGIWPKTHKDRGEDSEAVCMEVIAPERTRAFEDLSKGQGDPRNTSVLPSYWGFIHALHPHVKTLEFKRLIG